ncbi:MAG: FemAB family XrtA/PEP-CTERM system-associated protein [Candidatus Tectimicrobiota bacterium]
MTTKRCSSPLTYRLLEPSEDLLWDSLVARHPQGSVYHLAVWRHILATAFGKRWYLMTAWQDGELRAGLPFVHMQSWMFGNFLVSMPYVNYGGLLTEDTTLAEPLLQETIALGRQLGAQHLELRHLAHYYPQLPVRQEKVSMWLQLPGSAQELMDSFKAKLRSQIRKGEKNQLGVRIGTVELLEDFYAVFAHNMRDLGTPVYGKAIFRLILEAFPDTARLVVVTGAGQHPLAAGFLLGYRDRMEIPWASSLRAYNHLQSNMWLYWHCLRYACEQGYRLFDFGRCTVGEATFKFKEQWGAQPVQHYWHYHIEGQQQLPALNPQNPKLRLAIQLWQHLPVSLTRLVGPTIVKHLP